MKVKDQIRARREALGMDMQQLAMRVGVTEQAVRHWESGRSYPSKSKTRLLEEALSFTMDWSEGHNPVSEGTTAASMIDQADVDLLLVPLPAPTAHEGSVRRAGARARRGREPGPRSGA